MALTKIRGNTQILDLSITNAQIAAPDGANPNGIVLSKIQDGAQLIKGDGTVSFTAVVNGITPTSNTHLATKQYVDNVATGLQVKDAARVIVQTNISLTGLQTIDGVTLIAGDRVLVIGQTAGAQNGIYVAASGSWTRASDADTDAEVKSGMFTFVTDGTLNSGTGWVLSTSNPITLGTTVLTFAQFSSAGQVGAGAGLTKSGQTLDIVSGNAGILINANDISLQASADGTIVIGGDGIKMASLASGQIFVGNGSSVATARTVSGDITIGSTGVTTIGSNAVTTTKINAAAVTLPKLVTLTAAQIIIGTSSGNASVALSGDATMNESGVVTVNATNVIKTSGVVKRETPTGSVNGSNAVFVLANTPKTGMEEVYVNGILQDEGSGNDYTISGATITFTYNPSTGDKIRVSYLK
jgi:hypothetical protein